MFFPPVADAIAWR